MEKMLGISDICKVLGVSNMTFYRIRRDHGFPTPAIQIGKKLLRWSQSQLEAWVRSRSKPRLLNEKDCSGTEED